MSAAFPPLFHELEKCCTFSNVKVSVDQVQTLNGSYSISTNGPILFLKKSKSKVNTFILFIPNFTIDKINPNGRCEIVIKSICDTDLRIKFKFRKENEVNGFSDYWEENLRKISAFVLGKPNLDLISDKMSAFLDGKVVDVVVNVHYLKCPTFQVLRMDNAKVGFEIELTPMLNVLAGIKPERNFGGIDSLHQTFVIATSGKNNVERMFKCQNEETLVKWILYIFTISYMPRTICPPKPKQNDVADLPEKSNDVDNIEIEDIIFQDNQENELKIKENEKQVTIKKEDIPENKFEKTKTEVEENETQQKVPKTKMHVKAAILNKVKIQHEEPINQMKDIEPIEIPEDIDLDAKFVQLKEHFNFTKNEFVPSTFEQMKTLFNDRNNILDSSIVDTQLNNLISKIDDDEPDKIITDIYEPKSNIELLKGTIETCFNEPTINFTNLFDFSPFPDFNFQKFINHDSEIINPYFDIIDKLQINDERLAESLYFLTFILLLNGFKGLILLSSTSDLFITALKEIALPFKEYKELLDLVEKETTIGSQAAVTTCLLLSKNLLYHFVLAILKNRSWPVKYYFNSAYVNSETILIKLLKTLKPILSVILFNIQVSSNILISSEDIARYVFSSSFSFKEMDMLFQTNTNPIKIISRQFELFIMKDKNIVFQQTIDAWSILVEISNLDYQSSQWECFKNSIINTKGFIKNNSKLEMWVSEGIKSRKIHIWFLFVIVHQRILQNYYFKESGLVDLPKAYHIFKALYKYVRCLPEQS